LKSFMLELAFLKGLKIIITLSRLEEVLAKEK
jgi:hypothetical protein